MSVKISTHKPTHGYIPVAHNSNGRPLTISVVNSRNVKITDRPKRRMWGTK